MQDSNNGRSFLKNYLYAAYSEEHTVTEENPLRPYRKRKKIRISNRRDELMELYRKFRRRTTSQSALKQLKEKLAEFRHIYFSNYPQSQNKKIRNIFKTVPYDDIIYKISKAEVLQYNQYFRKHENRARIDLEVLAADERFVDDLKTKTLTEIYRERYVIEHIRVKIEKALLTNPKQLYPAARLMRRRFVIHCGGTNTGKTFNALKRLKAAKNGVYLGPLRLLALEIQETLMKDYVLCSMRTGEEEDINPYATHMASTVELADLHTEYEVCVIDECQMIGDRLRGCAWTRAILGMCADEIHLCTAPEGLGILIRLIEDCGDEYKVINYKRRAPLVYDDSPRGGEYRQREPLSGIDISKLEYGDALIAFSRKAVLTLADILRKRGISCSVIYGALPYHARVKQMQMFLDRETKVIVATDAIGMGLNLPIRRVLFTTLKKYDGKHYRMLRPYEIRQIAGRAGRIGMYDTGYVFSAENPDHVKKSLDAVGARLGKAYLDFDPAFVELDGDLIEILEQWSGAEMPEFLYEKVDIKRRIDLLRGLKIICRRNKLECDNMTAYKLTGIYFDESVEKAYSQWAKYAREYLSGKTVLSLPKIDTDSLMGLEDSFKCVDVYYSFCRGMGFVPDLDYIHYIKEYLTDEINYRLIDKNNVNQNNI